MANPLTSYQIVLIIILALNLFFWVIIICWRLLFMDGIATSSRRYCLAIRDIFRLAPSQNANRDTEAGGSGGRAVDMPPTYEEAVKFPSISSLLSTSAVVAGSSSGIVNSCCQSSEINHNQVSTAPDAACASGSSPSFATSLSIRKTSVRSLSCNDLESLSKTPPPFHTVIIDH